MDKTQAKWKYGTDIIFTRPQRAVDTIFLHCSASDVASHDDISVIKRWHMIDNGWSRVGYHFFINKNGDIQEGCPIEQDPIAQKGYNQGSIAICLHGLEISKFTSQQMESVKKLCKAITDSYDKKIRIRGHKEVSAKACPVFDYKTTLGLNAEGYYDENNSAATEPDSTAGISNNIQVLSATSNGPAVEALQALLTRLGFVCEADGAFGQATALQVKAFQKQNGLIADGAVGAETIDAMFTSDNLLLERNAKGMDVEVLQLLLALFGNTMIHDGIFGAGTEKALKNQQALLGLKADGVFGPISRKKMLA